jgi:hypothetical protein
VAALNHWEGQDDMLPDPARYEERYRLTGAALGLASAVLALGLGFLWHTQLIFAALTVLLAIARCPAVFIPWADLEKIILYSGYTSSGDQARYVAVQRRKGAPPLPYGNEQVPWCPVLGVTAGAARRIKSWRLDREQLAAVTAAVAPGRPRPAH